MKSRSPYADGFFAVGVRFPLPHIGGLPISACMALVKTRILRLLVWLRRYPGVVAAVGFVSGLGSFFLVERHEGFARATAVLVLLSWLWLVFEQLLRELLARRFGLPLPAPVLRYLTQLVHQESLFFALPFFIASTSWNSAQVLFTGLLVAAAVVAIVDPLYYRRLAPRRAWFLAYHALAVFAVLLVVLPLVLRLPSTQSYLLALAAAVLLSLPAVAASIAGAGWRRAALLLAIPLLLAALGWQARLWVPPASLRLADMALASAVDAEERVPADDVREVSAAQLQAEGLYAYTAIHAPLGLEERVFHVWLHEGKEVDRIALDIRGGRQEGYRAWTRKRNFPSAPQGAWEVRVLSADGRMIGTLRFRVKAETDELSRSVPTG